jgi:hypothetical protein
VISNLESKMKLWNKIVLILLLGTVWGVAELFGWDLLRALDVSNKSTYLFLVAFFILIFAKRIVPFFGSLFLISLVTIAYKTLGVRFFGCQAMAVAIDALTVDLAFYLLKEEKLKDWKWRSIAAPIMSIVAFAAFGFYREFIWAAPGYIPTGLSGVWGYMTHSALLAVILSIIVIHPAYVFGGVAAKKLAVGGDEKRMLRWSYAAGATLIVILWVALLFY